MICRVSPLLSLLTLHWLHGTGARRSMRIAAIFDKGTNIQHEIAFRHAVQMVNENRSVICQQTETESFGKL